MFRSPPFWFHQVDVLIPCLYDVKGVIQPVNRLYKLRVPPIRVIIGA